MKNKTVACARPLDDGMYHSNNPENIVAKFTGGNIVTGVVGLVGLYFLVHLTEIVINKISAIGVGL